MTDVAGLGDGVGTAGARTVFVPFAAPGDRVRAEVVSGRDGTLRATGFELLEPGPHRVAAPCRHFGTCGGCALQHLEPNFYAGWKRGIVEAALRRHGLGEVPVDDPVPTAPGARRRARFTAVGRTGSAVLGFNAAASHTVVDVAECPILTPRLEALLPLLRAHLADVLSPGERLSIEALDLAGGVDLLFLGRSDPSVAARTALAAFAAAADIARISWSAGDGPPEPIVLRAPVRTRFGGVAVDVPPGAFLQPTEAGEAALRDVVVAEAGAAARVVELFAGLGTFTLPLAAAGARVRAVEGSPEAIAALRSAAGRLRVETELRDLARSPVRAEELSAADLVVLDPPRAGALVQAEEIAASTAPRCIYVSCNPATFARDARRLADGGWHLRRVTPVDQFLWSPHVELVGVFARGERG